MTGFSRQLKGTAIWSFDLQGRRGWRVGRWDVLGVINEQQAAWWQRRGGEVGHGVRENSGAHFHAREGDESGAAGRRDHVSERIRRAKTGCGISLDPRAKHHPEQAHRETNKRCTAYAVNPLRYRQPLSQTGRRFRGRVLLVVCLVLSISIGANFRT